MFDDNGYEPGQGGGDGATGMIMLLFLCPPLFVILLPILLIVMIYKAVTDYR